MPENSWPANDSTAVSTAFGRAGRSGSVFSWRGQLLVMCPVLRHRSHLIDTAAFPVKQSEYIDRLIADQLWFPVTAAAFRRKAVSYRTQASPTNSWCALDIVIMIAVGSRLPNTPQYKAKNSSHVWKSLTCLDGAFLESSSPHSKAQNSGRRICHVYKLSVGYFLDD